MRRKDSGAEAVAPHDQDQAVRHDVLYCTSQSMRIMGVELKEVSQPRASCPN